VRCNNILMEATFVGFPHPKVLANKKPGFEEKTRFCLSTIKCKIVYQGRRQVHAP
jgi:hypothetical protein